MNQSTNQSLSIIEGSDRRGGVAVELREDEADVGRRGVEAVPGRPPHDRQGR